MATNLNKFLEHLHHLLGPPGGDRTDGQLLACFVAARDEAAFAALVRRHGPMVMAVCRRLLRHAQDAEDCFQATFMVLARKAATVKSDSVGSWLYAVAYRTALEARAVNARRRTHERQVQDMPDPEVPPAEAQDWRHWLDRELNRLPEKYRSPIVACDLEGRSRKEAARLLGLAEGTISSRLARGRRLLAKRLSRYGLSLSGGALAAALGESVASAQVPAALLSSTVKAAALVAAGEFTAVYAASAILMKGVLKSMFLAKLKLMVGVVTIVTALGASGLVYRASGQAPAPAEKRSEGKPLSELERLRHENELLKVNLEVVLEKVRAQEAELRDLKNPKKEEKTTFFYKLEDGIGSWNMQVQPQNKPVIEGKAVPKPTWEVRQGKQIPMTIVLDGKNGMQMRALVVPVNELQQTVDTLEKTVKELREQLKKGEAEKK